jgi:hypothetical protein
MIMGLARALLLLMVFAGAAPASRAGELVVIASTDPAVQSGSIVDGNRSLRVVAEASVVLISSTGKRIELAGPYSGVPEASAPKSGSRLVQSLSQLINKHAHTPERLAAFRSADKRAPAARPDIWGVDIARAGTYCLRADQAVMLWWDAARASALVSLSGGPGEAREVRIRWPNGQRHLAWPQALELADGAHYLVRFRASDAGLALITLQMPPLATDVERAAWMAEHGCTRQALAVVDAIARNELAPRP